MKVTGDATCPDCKKEHKVEFDFEKLDIKAPATLENATGTSQILEQKPQEPETKEVIKKVLPIDKPFYVCENGNCDEGQVHRNESYSKKPNKKCKNCDSLNGDKKCTNCGNKDSNEFDELDDAELEELGIPLPPENSHEGHNHE